MDRAGSSGRKQLRGQEAGMTTGPRKAIDKHIAPDEQIKPSKSA